MINGSLGPLLTAAGDPYLDGSRFEGQRTPLGPVVRYDPLPQQRPGVDRLVCAYQLGGPESGLDVRLPLSTGVLRYLLSIARRSSSWRLLIPMAGIEVVTQTARHGAHRFTTWTIVGAEPRPELLPLAEGITPTTVEGGVRPELWRSAEPISERVVQRVMVGGPAAKRDRRIYLHEEHIERLLAVAGSRGENVATLDMVGLRVRSHRAKSGHVYDVWTFCSLPFRR